VEEISYFSLSSQLVFISLYVHEGKLQASPLLCLSLSSVRRLFPQFFFEFHQEGFCFTETF